MKKIRFLVLSVILLLVTLCLIYAASVVIDAPRSNTFIGPVITQGYPLYTVSVNVSINVNATLLNVTIDNVEVCSNNTWNLSQYNCSWYVNETAEGNYTLSINITNSSGVTINNQSTAIIIDRTNATITLNYPANHANITGTTVNFNWTAIDNLDFSLSCNITVNNSINSTTESLNNTATNVSVANLPEGRHTWNVTCYDHTLNSDTSVSRDFIIDTSIPAITLNNPANGSSSTAVTFTFTWNATDNLATQMLCNLTIDSVIRAPNIESNNGSLTSHAVSLTPGTHYWNVTCIDPSGNSNTSLTWVLITSSPPPPGGSSGGGNSASRFYTQIVLSAINITDKETFMSVTTYSSSRITINDKTYDLRVSRILDDLVEFRIGDYYFEANKNEITTFDLDFDRKDDLSIKLIDVFFNRVNMLVKSVIIPEEIKEKAIEDADLSEEETLKEAEKQTSSEEGTQTLESEKQIIPQAPTSGFKKFITSKKEIIAIGAILVLIIFISLKYLYPVMKNPSTKHPRKK